MARLPKVEKFSTLGEAAEYVGLVNRPLLVSFDTDNGGTVIGRLHPNGKFENLTDVYKRVSGRDFDAAKSDQSEGKQTSIPEGRGRKGA